MSCLTGHHRVIASGACAACGLAVQATGPLPDAGPAPAWHAVPFGPDAATCRITTGAHAVDHATGVCTACSTRLETTGTQTTAVWIEWHSTPGATP